MQFYLNGYKPGDPLVAELDQSVVERQKKFPSDVDVLIVGSGPAGLLLAAQLANYPDINTVVVERMEGPLLVGQADGVACRTMEVLEGFGLADRLLREAYWVNEICFWTPDPEDSRQIVRTGRVRDTDENISEMPHVTVNQARLLTLLLGYMERSPSQLRPLYGYQVEALTFDADAPTSNPVRVTLRRMNGPVGAEESQVINAKYVVGCDGAHSTVRKSIGRELVGDASDTSWGVMDILGVTDFPDIRLKCVIRSANGGNILLIPREGGYLVRLYIEIDAPDGRGPTLRGDMTPEMLLSAANRALYPYSLVSKDIGWWSVYNIGQRLCDKFDDISEDEMATGRLPKVFIAGDACHTHSAKAGQGMNVSIADAWNLGWKLAAVIQGRAKPELLHTYSMERHTIAEELIDFDRHFARAMSAPPKVASAGQEDSGDAAIYQQYFADQLRFTAGTATCYGASMITAHPSYQDLATGFPVGMRFHSASVVRVADARQVQLSHISWPDGAWRIFVFGDSTMKDGLARWRTFCEYLNSDSAPLRRYTGPRDSPDSVIDVRAVLPDYYQDVAFDRLPRVLLPRKGRLGLIDYEKVFCAIPGERDIFDLRGINRETGCVIVVRPDQFVAHVLPLDAYAELSDFFAGVFLE